MCIIYFFHYKRYLFCVYKNYLNNFLIARFALSSLRDGDYSDSSGLSLGCSTPGLGDELSR